MKLRFGKYKGRDLRNVPKDYLEYLLKWEGLGPIIRDAIKEQLEVWKSQERKKEKVG